MIVSRGWAVGKKGDLKHRKESKGNVNKGNNVIKIRSFIIPLISMDRLSREKINKKIGVKHYTRCT